MSVYVTHLFSSFIRFLNLLIVKIEFIMKPDISSKYICGLHSFSMFQQILDP